MPRRKAAVKREVLPDPLYNSERLAKFINVVMRRGKKSLAEQIVYQALDHVLQKLKKDKKDDYTSSSQDAAAQVKKGLKKTSASTKAKVVTTANDEALDVFDRSLSNIRPTVEVKSRRVGGATYQVPIEVTQDRGVALAMRWLVKAAKARGEKTMVLRLAAEILDSFENRGAAVKMRDDMHRMAKANQAFAHYHW